MASQCLLDSALLGEKQLHLALAGLLLPQAWSNFAGILKGTTLHIGQPDN